MCPISYLFVYIMSCCGKRPRPAPKPTHLTASATAVIRYARGPPGRAKCQARGRREGVGGRVGRRRCDWQLLQSIGRRQGRGGEGQQEQGLGFALWSFEVPPQRLRISWAGFGVPSMSFPDLSHPYSLFFLFFKHLFILAALGPSCYTQDLRS